MPTTPNMTIITPSVSVTSGPEWAEILNAAFVTVDTHDHSTGKGVKITPLGLNINADLSIGSNHLNLVSSLRLISQGAPLATGADIRSLYSVSGDLYYNNGGGAAIQITSGGSVTAATDGTARRFQTQAIAANTTINPASTYSYIEVDTSSSVTITLPAANAVSAGRFYEVKDVTGLAATNNIIIQRAGVDTIDGVTSFVIDQPSGAMRFTSNGYNRWSLSRYSALPTGAVIPYSGQSAPFNFLFCYGQAISRTGYAELFDVIGTDYGVGDGATTFNVPDLRGRVIAGRDDMGGSAANRLTSTVVTPSGNTLGASGGAQTHTLITSEMPSHTHTQNAHNHGVPTYQGTSTPHNKIQGANTGAFFTDTVVINSTTATNQNTGGDGAHNNTQPTLVLNHIIRY